MPTISIVRDELFNKIGRRYTDEEFDEICFQFGIEIDDIINEPSEYDGNITNVIYKIDIGANRYDLLCIEGLSQALRIFLEISEYPTYNFLNGSSDFFINIEPDVLPIRPYVGVAILRDITITPEIFKSIIDLQEKLHHNICRKRKLVAIGIHDLDTIQLPLKYTAITPKDIRFKPLTIDEEMDAIEMFTRFEKSYLKEYLSIIRNESKYPIIVDSKNTILSLPPIINGQHSQVGLSTKNILIECTGTDKRRMEIVLLTVCTMLSEHCQNKYTIECGKIVNYNSKNNDIYTPCYQQNVETVSVEYLDKSIGIRCNADEYVRLLKRMSLLPSKLENNLDKLLVTIPPTRQDILHVCDIMEDAAISYGYNNINKVYPRICTVGGEQLTNRLCDKLRNFIAQCGFTETLSFIVCSIDDLSIRMHNTSVCDQTVKIESNHELNALRSNLLPGLLKTLSNNRKLSLPIKIFEIGDVVIRSDTKTSNVGATNQRRLCALYCGKNSGFEIIKGLLDKIMCYMGFSFGKYSSKLNFYLDHDQEQPSMLPGRNAKVMLMGRNIGTIGTIHPDVLKDFDLNYPCSILELCIENILSYGRS